MWVYLYCVDEVQCCELDGCLWSFCGEVFIFYSLVEEDVEVFVVLGLGEILGNYCDLLINLIFEVFGFVVNFLWVVELVVEELVICQVVWDKFCFYWEQGYFLQDYCLLCI